MINRNVCRGQFTRLPSLPCPECKQSTLECDHETIKRWPAARVIEGIDEGHIFRWDEYGVFTAIMKCSNQGCSQGMAALGDYNAYEFELGQMAYGFKYTLRDLYPTPFIIDIPALTSEPIASALKRSFRLFWIDTQACAGAIRVAIEEITAQLGQPRTKVSGSLGVRLEKLRPTHPQLVEAAGAIKTIGNDGAHGDEVAQDSLFACYELIEIELRRLFSDDETRRKAAIEVLKAK